MINWGYTELFIALGWREGGVEGVGQPGRKRNPFYFASSTSEQRQHYACASLPSFLVLSPRHAQKGFAIPETEIPESPNLLVHKGNLPLKWSGGMKALIVAYKTLFL